MQTRLTRNAFFLVVTLIAVIAATVVKALVPITTTHTVKGSHSSNSMLTAIMTITEDDTDLLSSLPAMSSQIKRQNGTGVHSKNNWERRERKRRRKQNEINNNNHTPKSNISNMNYPKKKVATASRRDAYSVSSELLTTIPKLSDILEGRAAFNHEHEEDDKGKLKIKRKQEIKITNTDTKQMRNATVPTRIVNNDVFLAGSTKKIETSDKNSNKDHNAHSMANNKKTGSNVARSSMKTSPKPSGQVLLPWRANYKASKRTQGRIQKAFTESTSSARGSHSRAQRVLDTLLETPTQYCNAVNLVCALTYSAKAMGRHRVDHMKKDLGFRKSLQETFDILHDLLVVHRDEGLFTPRQLCNVVWAIAKHFDRDPDLLLSQRDKLAASSAGKNLEFGMKIADKDYDSPELRLEETIDEIARQLTSILSKGDKDVSDVDAGYITKSKPIKSSFQQPKIKLGEICMACWAYGKLRPREIPPGWPGPPQMGAVKKSNAIVTDWKTEQLGSRRTFGSNFCNNESYDDEIKEISETDKLFDAMGYALCQSPDGEKQNEMLNDGSQYAMLEDCTWSELANVGWAFASHGRCRSTESETLLKTIAQEVANRLKDGNVANNYNYQDFLVRDVTQLLWSLGTLQSDNFRLADDLILLVESLTSNLSLGTKTRSRFAQGRPLRRWSCADLVQTAVALAHARIDENLLLRAIYEEGNFRLMEGASSSRRLSSLTTLPSEKRMSNNNLSLGEDRRTFHSWEASIMLWAQARLFLTEQEGVEFDEFAEDAPLFFLKALHENRGSFAESRIGPQEQANIVWSLVILEKYDSPEAIILIDLIFAESARSFKETKSMQLEHAHQLWQAYFILKEDCPEAVKRVPEWFVSYLKQKWSVEKARLKLSSARHQSLSSTLQFMGVDHINEHDEDIDVAIILQPNAVWVHETDMDEGEISELGIDGEDNVSVAVEFDGPNHFTRVRTDSKVPGAPRSSQELPRALGHTVLKYRLLKKQGWTVVRVPYYEFDKIPFWASMERQRYLQRKLKTHANIQFSESDVSEYKALTPNRESRFD